MNRTVVLLAVLALLPVAAPAETPATLRLDYFHAGSAEEERFSLDAIVLDAFSSDSIPVHLLTKEAIELSAAFAKGSRHRPGDGAQPEGEQTKLPTAVKCPPVGSSPAAAGAA